MKDIDKSELVEQAFDFWFKDNHHIRTPFPNYIHNELKYKTVERFDTWLNGLKEDFKEEMNEEMFAEKLEEILFEEGINLVLTEDEKNTILYPFLPRIGDQLNDYEGKTSEIVDRHIQTKEDSSFLLVKCKRLEDERVWETSFELPM